MANRYDELNTIEKSFADQYINTMANGRGNYNAERVFHKYITLHKFIGDFIKEEEEGDYEPNVDLFVKNLKCLYEFFTVSNMNGVDYYNEEEPTEGLIARRIPDADTPPTYED